jgi:hypothetical protein
MAAKAAIHDKGQLLGVNNLTAIRGKCQFSQ